jgi:hypothetical protein
MLSFSLLCIFSLNSTPSLNTSFAESLSATPFVMLAHSPILWCNCVILSWMTSHSCSCSLSHSTTLMPPNARPGEDPTNIITGTCKQKPSKCSILGNDLAQVKPKKVKVTTATSKKKLLVIRAVMALVKSEENAIRKPTKSKSCMFLL